MQNIFKNIKNLYLGYDKDFCRHGDSLELVQKLHFPELETLTIENLRYLKYFRNIYKECKKLRSVKIEGIES